MRKQIVITYSMHWTIVTNRMLYTFSYDVVFTSSLEFIVHKFKEMNARIVFSAEKFIWPDDTLEHLYPIVANHLPKYLNSGLFIGKSKSDF